MPTILTLGRDTNTVDGGHPQADGQAILPKLAKGSGYKTERV